MIRKKQQYGFSLIEIFVALAVGLFLFAGVMSIFVGMRTTTGETSDYGELQENGRFAVSLLTDDLLRQSFWGDYSGTLDRASLQAVPDAPTNDCSGDGVNNATFPVAVGHFRALWGDTVTTANIMDCITDARVGSNTLKDYSDVIQIKRVIANPATAFTAGSYYLTTNVNIGTILNGAADATLNNARSWEYQHHVYYVREDSQGSEKVPVLMQGRLVNSSMRFEPIIDGIEIIRFMYGVDTDSDGIVNAFVSADNMTNEDWNNEANRQILAVKVYVLVRNILPDVKYTNTNTYTLGDLDVTFNDNYRRLLFSSTVTLYNAGVDAW